MGETLDPTFPTVQLKFVHVFISLTSFKPDIPSFQCVLSDLTKFGQVFSGCIVLTVTSKLIILCKIGGVMRDNAEINYSGNTVLQCS